MDETSGEKALRVTVRLFASYRERAGAAELKLELPEGSTVSDLTAEVLRLYPALTSDVSRLVVAVNEEYQDHSHTLHDGDETALIPPVSGGFFARHA